MASATALVKTPERDEHGRLLPGNTANATGRRTIQRHVSELARRYTTESIECLVGIMRQRKDLRSAVRAAEVILDRGYGKSPVTVDVVHSLNDKELEETAHRILEKRKVIDGGQLTAKVARASLIADDPCICNRKHHGNARTCKVCDKAIVRRSTGRG